MDLRTVGLVLPLVGPICAQPNPNWKACPVIATLPADMNWTEPLEERRRFQLRQCEGHIVVVTGFEKGKVEPSLVFDTSDGYPRYLGHVFNVLVFQSMGGASDHGYIFAFRQGKPYLAQKTATKGHIEVKPSEESVTVVVPPTTYPGLDGRFPPPPPPKVYKVPIEY
ncbi:MAG: hypothetical protein J0L64_21900 [Acidobacteria bacterium]|nr:hypothetical protein [Acidobacteriota bacterium]